MRLSSVRFSVVLFLLISLSVFGISCISFGEWRKKMRRVSHLVAYFQGAAIFGVFPSIVRVSFMVMTLVLYSCGGEGDATDANGSAQIDGNVNEVPFFDFEHPGIQKIFQPGVGYDGSRFLVVFFGSDGATSQIFGTFISEDGAQSEVFVIVDLSVYLGGVTGPVLSFDGKNYLMVYDRMSRVYGVRITPDGNVLDADGGFQISNIVFDEEDNSPALAYDGTNYLVVWHKGSFLTGNRIRGAVVSPLGVPDDEFTIKSDSSSYSNSPAISFDGMSYLVSWDDDRNTGTTGHAHIYVARITKAGVVLDPEGYPITETASWKFSTRSTFDGTYHHVSWMDRDLSQIRYFSKRIATDGFIVDGPTTNSGNLLKIIAVDNKVIIGGEKNKILWPMSSSGGGIKGIANGSQVSLAVWVNLKFPPNGGIGVEQLKGAFIPQQ